MLDLRLGSTRARRKPSKDSAEARGEIADAEREWRATVAEREAAQAKHNEAHRIYLAQRSGEPPAITAAQVDEMDKEMEPYQKRERGALEILERHGGIERRVGVLVPKIDAYRAAIRR